MISNLLASTGRPRAATACIVATGAILALLATSTVEAAITATGDVTPDPATANSNTQLYVGDVAAGSLSVNGGSDVVALSGFLGNEAAAVGVAAIDGSGSTWTLGQGLQVGSRGSGILQVTGGGLVQTGSGRMGVETDSIGSASVSGAGSKWTNSSVLIVGDSGEGTLVVSDGGEVTSEFVASISNMPGSSGSAIVQGNGSKLTVNHSFGIGVGGAASLLIADGGLVTTHEYGIVGSGPDSVGEVTVAGAGSEWRINSGVLGDDLYIAYDGAGTLNILNGGKVDTTGFGIVGYSTGSVGTVTIDGPGSLWDNDLHVVVGNYGSGSLEVVSGGSLVSHNDSYIGFSNSSAGSVRVTGTGSRWDSFGGVTVGSQGTGTLEISDGGTVDATGQVWVSLPGGMGSISFAGGKLTAGALLAPKAKLLGTGTIHTHGLVSDVDLAFDASHGFQQQLALNSQPGQQITIELEYDGTAPLGAGYGGQGSLVVGDGKAVASPAGWIGYLAGSSGSVTVEDAGSSWTNSGVLTVGHLGHGAINVGGGASVVSTADIVLADLAGSSATATVDGVGSLLRSQTNLVIGSQGSASLNITGGGQARGFFTYVGRGASAAGTVKVSGAGSLFRSGDCYIGRGEIGDGDVTVENGGAMRTSNGYIGSSAGSSVTVDGAGSSWVATQLVQVGRVGLGTLRITQGGLVDVNSHLYLGYFSTGNGRLELVDGTLRLHGGNLVINSGVGTFAFEGGRVEGVGTINLHAPLVQSGGTLAPGNSVGTTIVESGYTLNAGRLEFEINGLGTPGTNWDLLRVNGAVNLLGSDALANGELAVLLGFAPALGNQFLILQNDYSAPITGTFASGAKVSADFGNRRFDFEIRYNAGDGNDIALFTQAIHLIGDFNEDGRVDAADYTKWRDGLGTTYTQAQYNEWRSHFGQTAGSASSASAIPEPAGASLLFVAIAAAITCFRAGRTN
ncbi:MAG: hypothetical protein AB7G28_18425 [Pirellulales bacterium]